MEVLHNRLNQLQLKPIYMLFNQRYPLIKIKLDFLNFINFVKILKQLIKILFRLIFSLSNQILSEDRPRSRIVLINGIIECGGISIKLKTNVRFMYSILQFLDECLVQVQFLVYFSEELHGSVEDLFLDVLVLFYGFLAIYAYELDYFL